MFADVATDRAGRVYGVRRPEPASLEFCLVDTGEVLGVVSVATSHLVYPRLAVSASGVPVCIAVAGHTDHAVVVTADGRVRDLGWVASGGQPVAIRPGVFGGVEVAAVLFGGRTFDRLGLSSDLAFATPTPDGPYPVPLPAGETSGGFLDWTDEAGLVWVDAVPAGASEEARFATVAGRRLVYPMRRGDWTVGQDGSGPDRVLAYQHSAAAWFVVFDGHTNYPPRVAARPDGSCVVGLTTGAGLFVRSGEFVPMPATEPIAVIGRPLWLGWFEFAGSVSLAPGNCVLPVIQGAPWQVLTAFDGSVIARYVAGDPDGDVDALARAIVRGKADGMGYPVIAYWTRRAQAVRVPGLADILGVEAYRGLDESVAQFEARLDRACARNRAVVLIAQCYTSNRTQTDDLASIVPVVARVARRHLNVIGVLGFSGGGRETGYQDHPEVHAAWRALFAGIPGAPAIGPRPVPTPDPVPEHPQPTPTPVSIFPRARSFSHV